MPSESTKVKAIAALEGMRQIVRREMVVAGRYVEDDVSNPRLTKAICGGRKHCAIGSLWAGGGIKARVEDWGHDLPGADQDERDEFLRHRPALRLAYDSLNAAAETFIAGHGELELDTFFSAPVEALFEGSYGDGDGALTKRDLLAIIATAKRNVAKA